MTDLPAGWIQVALQDVVEINPKRDANLNQTAAVSFVPMAALDELSGKIVGATARPFHEVSRGFTPFKEGDVLFAKITPSMENGKSAVARNLQNGIGFGSTEFHVLRSKGAVVPEFIWHFIRRPKFRGAAKEVMTGAVGQLRVPADYLKKHEFPVPPLSEQKRIVQTMDALMERTEAARSELTRVEQFLSKLKERVLAAAIDGRLTAEWRRSNSRPSPETVTLGEVCTDITYGSSAKSSRFGEMPVLRMGNIQDGVLDWNDLAYTSDKKEIERYSLRVGDVLFNRTNSPELVGKTAMYAGERPAIYAGYLIRIRCSKRLNPRFLTYCLNSPIGRDYSWSVKSDGVSQSNINAEKLKAFRFLLPDRAEQDEIVSQLNNVFSRIRGLIHQASIVRDQIFRLEQQIAERAFRGELVPQNPNDESASVLLERLKAEPESTAINQSTIHEGSKPVRAPRRKAEMTKNRTDHDVWHRPYLAELLRAADEGDLRVLASSDEGGQEQSRRALAVELFEKSELTVVDFYKQLAWEVEQGHIVETDGTLRAA